MTFLNPIMLAGIGAAVLPVVVHLLSRARYRTIDWGAMMFLSDERSSQQRIGRLRQWILLAIRSLLLAVLAMAMARPVIGAGSGDVTAPKDVAIILDGSGSMSFTESGRARIDLARDAIAQVISTLGSEDRAGLVLASTAGSGSPEAVPVPLTDEFPRIIAATAAAPAPTMARADLPAAVKRAMELVEASPRRSRKLAYVITDHQAVNWQDVETPLTSAHCEIRVIPVGSRRSDNVAITGIDLSDSLAIRGQPVEARVSVRNFSDQPVTSLPLQVSTAGETVSSARVDVPARSSAMARVTVTLNASGSQVLRAAIAQRDPASGDGLAMDDELLRSVDVIDAVRVLVVSGDERPQPLRSESSFLKLALAPYASSSGASQASDPARVDVIPFEHWTGAELESCDVLVLANVPRLNAQQVRRVEQFIFGGRGLLIAPGALTDVRSYNGQMHRGGEGILPVALREPTEATGASATRLLGMDVDHPALTFLRGQLDPVPQATVGRYFPTGPISASAAVRAGFVSGEPFLVESVWGRGRVMLMTTPLDADWSSLPMSSFYLPFVQSIVKHLAGGTVIDRNLRIGQPLMVTIAGPVEEAQIIDPTGAFTAGIVSRTGIMSNVHHRGSTRYPGVYRVEYAHAGQRQSLKYVVQPDTVESDLAPMHGEQWVRLERAGHIQLVSSADGRVEQAIGARDSGTELWMPLLLAFVLLGITELAVQWWPGKGSA